MPSLPPSLRNPPAAPLLLRRVLRLTGWLLLGAYFASALLFLALRYFVLPNIESYRGDLEAALTQAIKRPVAIGTLDAGWAGLRPQLSIRNFVVRDVGGQPALGLDNVEVELAWSSLWHGGLQLSRLEIDGPDLNLRRDARGHFFIAGLELDPEAEDAGFADWLLAQDRIVVRDATVRWHDELRGAPPLALRRLNIDFRNSGRRHRFGITAEPPPELAARLDVRGDLSAADPRRLDTWHGELFTQFDYTDLAAWRNWIDYPLELPQGAGALRLWLALAGGQPSGFTADLRLADVQLRLKPDLPMLDLASLEGRLAGKRLADGHEAKIRRLSLATRDGMRIGPADASLQLRDAGGEFEANALDIGALAALAAHLPLADELRSQLAAYAPRGRLHQFKTSWRGKPERPETWRVAGNFDNLGIAAQGRIPGFTGIGGSIDGNERGGSIGIVSQRAVLDLPGIFADPRLALDALGAKINWRNEANGTLWQIARAEFRNRDAAGEASGSYKSGNGLGDIDLTARLTRGSGTAVWRYMPLVVGKDARDWLRDAITAGTADEATLRLKGNLDKFPFKDGRSGIFEVKGRFRGARLRYAAAWPEIRDIEGELLFQGARMRITGRKGNILGAAIGPVTAEIADLEAPEELLVVEGRAAGPTAEFLRFIEASPVGERIGHATEDMTATGTGELRLRLDLPLRRIADSKVDGRFRVAGNKLLPVPGMPPLTDVAGELHFTGDRIEAQKLRAALLGLPATADIATNGDGNVVIKAAGGASVRALAQQYELPLFNHLAGTTTWNATVAVRRKTAELRIESALQGISSSLPPPFNKSAADSLPLVVEHKPINGRDQLAGSLGNVLRFNFLSRADGSVERGAVGIGAALPKMPERGVAAAVQAPRIDLDFWRRLGNGSGGGLPLRQFDLRSDELVAFGRSVAGLRLTGNAVGNVWKLDLRSRDANGNLEWDSQGAGRISGHLTQLTLAESTGGSQAEAADEPQEMPAIDLVIDRCNIHGKDLGAVRLKAENSRDGYWNARFDMRSDDATLEGSGRWRSSATAPESRLEFKLTARSIEKLLARLGYPDAVRRGSGNLEGTLSWRGAPTAIDYASLGGNLKFEAVGGQFNKLEPGVGRLLGVLSLQSLPRRLTLDFRDVFSEGFAFDAIAGQATVSRGIMETGNLQIAGPAARVMMSGSVNLGAETQNLRVRVQPAIGETVATGVLLAHPATGATAWLINKLFGNPLDKAFAYDYAVSGSWADPKVEKVSGPAPEARDAKEGSSP